MKILGEVTKQELKDFLYYGMELEDKNLYKEINNSQSNIFQFSGATAAGMVKRAIPLNFDDLISINCLSRPGSSFQFDDFVKNGQGSKNSKYPKFISKHLEDTHGCILTQEQIMAISSECGLDPNVVRGLLKKLGKANKKKEDLEAWEKIVEQFKKSFKEKGMTDNEINLVIDDFITLSAYSFNKSHAACYSAIACITLYMTYYFRPYFWAASLSYDATKLDALKESIFKAKEQGFTVLPPDVNESLKHFTPTNNGIKFGLNEIKGVGEEPCNAIMEHRPYTSIIDFICKNIEDKRINKKVTMALLHGGAFDSLIGEDRKYYESVTANFYEKKGTKKTIPVLEEKWEEVCESTPKFPTVQEDYMQDEIEYLGGLFFHGIFSSSMQEKIEEIYKKGLCLRNFKEIREKNLNKQRVPVHLNSYRRHIQKNGKEMCFFEIEDCNGEKASVPCFGNYWEICKQNFFEEGFYFMDLYADENEKIMFGSKSWIRSPETIKNMLLPWRVK